MIRLSQLVINVWPCSAQDNARFEALSKVCTIVADNLREPIEMALQQQAGGLRPKARVFATALLISSGIDAPCPREHVLDACETASAQLSACPSDSSRCMMVHLLVQAMVRHRGAIEILREGTDEVQGLISSLLMSIPLASKVGVPRPSSTGPSPLSHVPTPLPFPPLLPTVKTTSLSQISPSPRLPQMRGMPPDSPCAWTQSQS
jgi:hypothetical protein